MSISVSADVPHGNVADVAIHDLGDVCRVEFAAHPHGGPEALWFCFRVHGSGASAQFSKLRLALKHGQNMLGVSGAEGLRPVVRQANCNWRRLGAGAVEQIGDGRDEIVWDTEPPKRHLDVALCYPYGKKQLDRLIADTGDSWTTDVIGVSQSGRQLQRLSNDYGAPDSDRPGIYMVARQHSGETPGSWVLDGVLRHIAALGGDAPLVWAVPLSNIDGVEGGDYGKDNFPYDLNRAWGSPPMRHEVLILERDIRRFSSRCRPVAAVDFHAPGGCESDGAYCFVPAPGEFRDRYVTVLQLAGEAGRALGGDYAASDFVRFAEYASRWETPNFTGFCAASLRVPAFTLETPYGMAGERVLTQEDYQEAGRRIARGIMSAIG